MKKGCCLFLLGGVISTISISAQTFTDVAQQKGIFHSLNSTDNWGSGVSFFDFNDDGWDDLTFPQEDGNSIFFLNNEGNFEEINDFIYNEGQTKQVLWVDYDNDGDYDLVVTTREGRYRLFNNNGNFEFTDVSEEAGLSGFNSVNFGVSFCDYNKDGYLDFYLCRYYGFDDPDDLSKVNALYRNNGDGTFTNVALEAGVTDGIAPSFQGVWLDYNKDGWPDLYVINDRHLWDNSLYKNNGDGTFTYVSDVSGTASPSDDPMSATVGDFNNDGFLDIYTSNTGTQNTRGRLFVNNGDETFTESGASYGVDIAQWSWGATWIDYNNDTYQDLYVTTGRITTHQQEVRSYFYVNQEADVFTDEPDLFVGNHVGASYSVAKGDFNNDGFADLVVHNAKGLNAFLWENSGNQNNYIKVTLEGTVSNRMAISSWINVYAGGNHYVHYTMCGENYMSQNSQHHIFGLGQLSVVDSIVVEYLSGIKDRYYELDVNQHYYFVEGETHQDYEISYSGPSEICEGDTVVLDAGMYEEYQWNTGHDGRFLTVYESGNYWVTVTDGDGMELMSQPLEIEVFTKPEISPIINHVSCYGEQDGSITLNIVNATDEYDITWSNDSMGDAISNLWPGIYSYSYQDVYGCSEQGYVELSSPYPLYVHTMTTPQTDEELGVIQFMVTGGTSPYEVFFEEELIQESIIQNIPAGEYILQILDANGCEHEHVLNVDFVETHTAIESYLEEESFRLFPNPTRENFFFIEGDERRIEQVHVYDMQGRRIASRFDFNRRVTLLEPASGMLIVEVVTDKTTYYFKVIKD